ncbi:hypothetical protein GGR51DRAFT_2728 [Nemania sp. FL0031]|nr:hypothetical protein GGR51DRAFT_2728 [Nemania sp. FL0031]
MLRGSSPSSGPKAVAGETASKNSNGSGGVLTRVLSSLRRDPRDGDATANAREDANWANNYTITHRPDRPRQDMRESLRHRNSVYVLGQLRKIWQHSARMADMKKKGRETREREAEGGAATAEPEGSSSRGQSNRDGDSRGTDASSDSSISNTGRRSRPPVPTLQTNIVPNFSRKDPSPEFARSKWRLGDGEQHDEHRSQSSTTNGDGSRGEKRGHPALPQLSLPDPSDRMIIKVGMTLQSPYRTEGSGGFMTDEGGMTGGYDYAHNDTETSSSKLFPDPRPPKASTEAVRPLSRSPLDRLEAKYTTILQQQQQQQPSPATAMTMQPSSTRARTPLQMTTAPLYINTEQDNTPGLILNSSPVSGHISPWTPVDDASDDEGVNGKSSISFEPQKPKVCPMPLCGSPLLTLTDRKHNLCGRCRAELQPRQSIFTTDVLNPFSHPPSPTNKYPSYRMSLFPDKQQNPPAEVKSENAPETSRSLNGESKRARLAGDQPTDRVYKTGVSPSAPRRKRSGRVVVASRFNKGRGEFKLQPVPLSRKHSRRGQKSHTSNPPQERLLRNVKDEASGDNHIGFQLAGWPAPRSDPSPQPSSPGQKKLSGPLLEPKTFSPAAPTRKSGGVRRKPSVSRPRAKGGGTTTSSSGQISSPLPRGHVEKTRVHKTNSPKSPGHRRNRHPENLHHIEDRAAASRTNISGGPRDGDVTGMLNAKEKAVDDEDIYREIENIIDCYLSRPDAPESEKERRKAEAVASYFAVVPLEVEMRIKGFI